MRNIIYLPLESYTERYTCQLSRARTGWLERRWIEADQPYIRIEGDRSSNAIKHGVVLDVFSRSTWCLEQMKTLVRMIEDGHINSDDAIYFDDFWQPGFSALPYVSSVSGIKPKSYALLHAQSVDEFDFTYPMRRWIRLFELGHASVLSGIFVTSTMLKEILVDAGFDKYKIHITGLPYCSDEVQEYWPKELPKRKRQVVYSSRWDKEKNPSFFLKVAHLASEQDPTIKFVVTTSQKKLRSNDPSSLDSLKQFMDTHNNVELREGQTKEQYYYTLLESQIQFNCAYQDWVSWTLLEATTCGCHPVYPHFRSFPEVVPYKNMYKSFNEKEAFALIKDYIDEPTSISNYHYIYEPFNSAWERMLNVMKGVDNGRYFIKRW